MSSLDHLLLPMPPTPNGRMHIGHASGPYLRCDALARSLRRAGRRVFVASGSDAHENWVLKEARRLGESPEATCHRNHRGIAQDFAHLGVRFDLWIDPLSGQHAGPYREVHERLVGDLIERGGARAIAERVPVSVATGEYVIGAWIAGDCPHCEQPVSGNSCVRCGGSFQPAEIKRPRSQLDDSELRWVEKPSWFVDPGSPAEIYELLARASVPAEFRAISEAHMARAGTRVRVTQPGRWGVKSALVDDDCVLTNTFYAYCLYAAEVAAHALGEPASFLDAASTTEVVALFGKDNAGVGLVAPYAISLASGQVKAFDRIIVNHLLYFEQRKCSTSRKHGIWVSELIENSSVSGDELRYCLAQAPLETEAVSLSLVELVRDVNELRAWRADTLATAWRTVGADPDSEVLGRAMAAVVIQASVLRPDHLAMKPASAALRQWMFATPALDDARRVRAWLVGLALLAEPIVPQLAREVWSTLGLPGQPTLADAASTTEPGRWQARNLDPLTAKDIAPFAHISLSAG